MASKINTNNPKHHKYVDTNKYQRKKINTKLYNIPIEEHNLACLKPLYFCYIWIKYNIIKYNNKDKVRELRYGYGKTYTGTCRKNYHRKYYAKASRLKYTADMLK